MIRRKKNRNAQQNNAPKHKVDYAIRDRELMVIDDEGNQLGVLSKKDAIAKAKEKDLNLVLVGMKANPPVAKIMDYGKFKYEQGKRERKSKANQTKIEIKEIKLRPKIGSHDLETKLKHSRKFLEAGNKVKFIMQFRGREMSHQDIGRNILTQVKENLQELGKVEFEPKLEGRNLTMIMIPAAA